MRQREAIVRATQERSPKEGVPGETHLEGGEGRELLTLGAVV